MFLGCCGLYKFCSLTFSLLGARCSQDIHIFSFLHSCNPRFVVPMFPGSCASRVRSSRDAIFPGAIYSWGLYFLRVLCSQSLAFRIFCSCFCRSVPYSVTAVVPESQVFRFLCSWNPVYSKNHPFPELYFPRIPVFQVSYSQCPSIITHIPLHTQ